MGHTMAPMSAEAKRQGLVERAGALLRAAAPGLVPAGIALAFVGMSQSSYWLTVGGLVTAIYATVAATRP